MSAAAPLPPTPVADPVHSSTAQHSTTTVHQDDLERGDALSNFAYDARPDSGKSEEVLLVEFAPDDPDCPINWSFGKKVFATGTMAVNAFVMSLMASSYLFVAPAIQVEFGARTEVVALGFVLYVAGFGIGPLFMSPISDSYGRKWIITGSMALFTLFHIGAARAENIATLLVCRALAGTLGSAGLVLGSPTLLESWTGLAVSRASSIFMTQAYTGSAVGPIFGGLIVSFAKPVVFTSAGWRILFYLAVGIGAVFTLVLIFFFPETHHATILRRRAAKLRKQHPGRKYITKLEIDGQPTVQEKFKTLTLTAAIMLVEEPVIIFIGIWQVLLAGVMYSFFDGFAVVFGPDGHNFEPWAIGLSFLGIFIGMVVGTIFAITFELKYYVSLVIKAKGKRTPEMRIPIALFYSFSCTIGLFLFAATARPTVHWIVPIIGSALFGFGFVNLLSITFLYLVDTYAMRTPSAVAAVGLVRSVATAPFPLFSTAFYTRLSPQNAVIILASISVLMSLIAPFAYRYGVNIRAISKYAYKS